MAPRNRNNNRRSATSEGGYSRADLEREFPDDSTCLEWLWRQNHSADGERADCPKCGVERKFHRVASRPSYSCDVCGHHLHPTAGTIFHKSSTGLDLWFRAIYIMSSTRCGASAKQIERELGVTYKTAWRMANRIRTMLMDQPDTPLDGEVEVDETFVGGKPRAGDIKDGRAGSARWRDQKSVVWGAVERGGQVRAKVVPHVGGGIVRAQVRKFVLPSAVVFTDEAPAYITLPREGYEHHRINHRERVYVKGNVHTQTIEGFWSMVKGGLQGTHHSVSRKWLQSYLDEYVWRYNHRADAEPMFKSLLGLACQSAG
jgi:transposase-like protein